VRITGLGVDLVSIPRMRTTIDRWQARFVERVFTDDEIIYCRARRDPAPHFAARFAAKEAGFKALGTGLQMGVRWRELADPRPVGTRQGDRPGQGREPDPALADPRW